MGATPAGATPAGDGCSSRRLIGSGIVVWGADRSVERLYDPVSLESLAQNLLGKIVHMWLNTDPEALILSGSVPLAKYLAQVDSLCLGDSGGELAWTSPHPETHSGFWWAGGPTQYRLGPA